MKVSTSSSKAACRPSIGIDDDRQHVVDDAVLSCLVRGL
jgi:hypothetical protein